VTLKELLDFAAKTDEKLIAEYGENLDMTKAIFAQTIKLNEEVGELCEAILSAHGLQRPTKHKQNLDHVAEELVDVLMVTLVMAHRLGTDVEPALRRKMAIIMERLSD
jgi:NTP pyrophosphatase (non-canonical NTP hydrolase)